MKQISNPTYQSDSGTIHTSAEACAKDDAHEFFKELLERNHIDYDSSFCGMLSKEWQHIHQRLTGIQNALNDAQATKFGVNGREFETGAVPR